MLTLTQQHTAEAAFLWVSRSLAVSRLLDREHLRKQIASLSTLMNSPADGTPRRNRKRTEEEKSLKAAAAAAEKSRENAEGVHSS